ncbi:uncharacterized protein LOC106160765 [Lingula anatina]|uniref:Uncharacterized protein LOC106160765 n=1 Tax=Lingula anatina TaxID=7574 RepID=A0A1S3I3R8_LINAN|nr:uncharacterized protein LOC106160765 [Lingula anatina]|eukprot:XP_013392912.1 uncharacterized protein LOC106160765 [Lingula anatina]
MVADVLESAAPLLWDILVSVMSLCSIELSTTLFACLLYISITSGIVAFLLVQSVRSLHKKLNLTTIPYSSISRYSTPAPFVTTQISLGALISTPVPPALPGVHQPSEQPPVPEAPAKIARPKTRRRDLEISLAAHISGVQETRTPPKDRQSPSSDHTVIWHGPYPNSKPKSEERVSSPSMTVASATSQLSVVSKAALLFFCRILEMVLVTQIPCWPVRMSKFFPRRRWSSLVWQGRRTRKARIPLRSCFSEVDVPAYINRIRHLSSCSADSALASDLSAISVPDVPMPLINRDNLYLGMNNSQVFGSFQRHFSAVCLGSNLRLETDVNTETALD